MPSLALKADAIPGRLNSTGLIINRPSTFYGQCSELCGVMHGLFNDFEFNFSNEPSIILFAFGGALVLHPNVPFKYDSTVVAPITKHSITSANDLTTFMSDHSHLGGIYALVDRSTNKDYVGKTNSFGRRMKEHFINPPVLAIDHAIQKHGLARWDIYILRYIPTTAGPLVYSLAESYYVDLLQPYYNIRKINLDARSTRPYSSSIYVDIYRDDSSLFYRASSIAKAGRLLGVSAPVIKDFIGTDELLGGLFEIRIADRSIRFINPKLTYDQEAEIRADMKANLKALRQLKLGKVVFIFDLNGV